MLAGGGNRGGWHVPIVHECARQGCETLTMGEFCLEHEQQGDMGLRMRVRRMLPRLTRATALVAAAAAGALIGTRFPR
jgi:hypothetical protein